MFEALFFQDVALTWPCPTPPHPTCGGGGLLPPPHFLYFPNAFSFDGIVIQYPINNEAGMAAKTVGGSGDVGACPPPPPSHAGSLWRRSDAQNPVPLFVNC